MPSPRKRIAAEMKKNGEHRIGNVAVLRCDDPDPEVPTDWKISPNVSGPCGYDEDCYWGSFLDALNALLGAQGVER